MRLVMVFPDPPLPFGDAAARIYYVLVKGHVQNGHRVIVFCGSSKPEQHARQLAEVFPSDRYDIRLYPHQGRRSGALAGKLMTIARPFSYMFSEELRRDLDAELARGFDALHMSQLWAGWVGLKHVERSVLHIHYLFSIDLTGGKPKSLTERVLRIAAVCAERRLLRRYRVIASLTGRIANAVKAVNPSAHTPVIATGLDLSLYEFPPVSKHQGPPTIGLIGSFFWDPTVSAAERLLKRLWPEIRRQVPEAQLRIVGRQARTVLAEYVNAPGVSIEQDVEDIQPYFHALDVMLYAPRIGSGIKVKITESMATGVAVVTNTDGAEGLPIIDGVHADVTDDDAELIARAVRLLKDPELRQRRRVAARQMLVDTFTDGHAVHQFEELYESMMNKNGV